MIGACLTPRVRDAIAIAALAGFLFFHNIGNREIRRASEGRVARVAQEMLDRNDWVVPYLNGKPRLQKPPMSSWLVALHAKFFGNGEVTVKDALVPPAASAVALAVLLYLWLSRLKREGDPDGEAARAAGMFGALALVLMPAFLGQGRCAEMDMFVALCTALAYFAFERAWFDGACGWWLGFYLALTAGFLTKGHVVLVNFLPAVLVWGLWQRFVPRNSAQALNATQDAPNSTARGPVQFSLQALLFQALGLGLFLGLILAWGIPFLERSGMTWEAFKTEGLARFSEKTTGHVEAWYFYAVNVPVWSLPAFLLIPFLAWRDWNGPEDAHKPRRRLWWCWFAVNLLLWSVLAAKQRHYTIPWLPPLALLAGDGLMHLLREARSENPFTRLLARAGSYVFVALWALAAVGLVVYAQTAEARRDAQESPAIVFRTIRSKLSPYDRLYDANTARPHRLFYLGRTVEEFRGEVQEEESEQVISDQAGTERIVMLAMKTLTYGDHIHVMVNDDHFAALKRRFPGEFFEVYGVDDCKAVRYGVHLVRHINAKE